MKLPHGTVQIVSLVQRNIVGIANFVTSERKIIFAEGGPSLGEGGCVGGKKTGNGPGTVFVFRAGRESQEVGGEDAAGIAIQALEGFGQRAVEMLLKVVKLRL